MLKSKVNLTTKQNHKPNKQNHKTASRQKRTYKQKICDRKQEKKFKHNLTSKHSNCRVPKYRLRCHTQGERNGFDKFELYG